MASPTTSRIVIQYSPSKLSPSPGRAPRRAIQPSPEKTNLSCTTIVISPQKRTVSATAAGSPTKKTKGSGDGTLVQDTEFSTILGVPDPARAQALRKSKRIELSTPLLQDGRADGPLYGDWSEVFGLYNTTFSVEVSAPFLIIRLHEVPPKPWPLTIGGLPVWFTSEKFAQPIDRGRLGGGIKILEELDLRQAVDVDKATLNIVASRLIDTLGSVFDLFWWAGFWTVTVADNASIKTLPMMIGRAPAFYKRRMDQSKPDPSALRRKPPSGVDFDNTSYDMGPNAALRPGVMLSSLASLGKEKEGQDKGFFSTTSGILVTDRHGHQFITAASHGFVDDHEVWHPTPRNGRNIGKVVEKLSETDISIVELNPGITYTNTTFGTEEAPQGTAFTTLSSANPPELKMWARTYMDNPYSGRSEGTVVGTGLVVPDFTKREFIGHNFSVFENGDEPVDGSCGSPIWDDDEKVVGFFRFQFIENNTRLCLSVKASCLPEHGYSILEGNHTFTG